MTIKQTQRKRIFKSGLGMLLLGATLGVTGYVSAPANAADNDQQITICHQEGNGGYTSPNPNKSQILDVTNGHGFHVGNGVLRGDIIPPFAAGSQGNNSWEAFDGLNWDVAGRAIYDTCAPCTVGTHDEFGDCTVRDPQCLPGQTGAPPNCQDPQCDPGQTGTFPNCVNPACTAGQTGTFPDCQNPQCPQGQTGTPPNCSDPLVIPVVIPVVPAEVEGAQIGAAPAAPVASTQVAAAELPRTGTNTRPLAELGLGLILLGAGALIFGREQTITV